MKLETSALAAALLSLAACDVESPYCESSETPLFDLGRESPGGIDGGDVLGPAQGSHAGTLSWARPSRDTVYVDVGRPAEEIGVTIEVEYADGDVRWVGNEAVYPDGSSTLETAICDPRLEVEVVVHLQTDDGALDERFEVPLARVLSSDHYERYPEGASRVRTELDLDALGGSLEVASVDPPDPSEVSYFLELVFTDGRVEGEIRGVAEYDDGDTASAGRFTVATIDAARDPGPTRD